MDIYVLVEDGKVLGAGSDLATAMDIVDRRDQNAWTTWHPFTDSWERKHRRPAGHRQPVCQQIVRVPLAGATAWDGSSDPLTDMRAFSGERLATIGYARVPLADGAEPIINTRMTGEPDPPSWTQMCELVNRLRPAPMQRDKVRCGSGDAWRWVQRGLDGVAPYPAGQASPDSVAARIWGIDVVLDPNMPPDMIRFGTKVFVINGDVVREIDMDQLSIPLADGAIFGFTSPRG